jgi:hypothetical protein
MAGKRMIITLSEEDKRWLASYSHAHQISVAEAVRKGIRKLKKDENNQTYRELVKATRGVWKRDDGLTYQEKIRSDWDSRC